MEINKNNYEAYLLDYFENNLTPEQVAELMIFLQVNPELNIDLEGLELIGVSPDKSIVFEDKSSLKHTDIKPYAFLTPENYEEYFVASVDGELSVEEEKDLEIFIGLNPQLKSEYELFGLTVLTPDTRVVFPKKSSLKKGAFGIAYVTNRQWLYSSVAVAASIALLIGIFFDFSSTPDKARFAQDSHPERNTTINIPHNNINIPHYSPAKQQSNDVNIPPAADKLSSNETNAVVNQGKQHTSPVLKPEISGIETLATLSLTQLPVSNSVQPSVSNIPRTYYTELYGYIQLREQREYQEYLDAREARSWYAKAFGEVKTLVAGPDIYDPKGVRRDNEIWMLAEAGIKGINYITKSNFQLKRQLDEDGRTSAYAVASKKFEYSEKIGK